MKTFEQFIDGKGYDYGSFDRCHEMDSIINEYGEYCATVAQQSLLSGFLFEKIEEVSKVNNIELENGKYKVIDELGKESPRFYALRDGEEWRDLTGDKLVYSMFCEIIRLREKINYITQEE